MMEVDTYKEIIERYKELLRIDGYIEEEFKWVALKEFGGRPNLEALDFEAEMQSIKFQNLIFKNASAAINHICKEKSEEYRQILMLLFDETQDLNFRISECTKLLDELYGHIAKDPSHRHHHGERELATFLTFQYPDKYPLYKDSFYRIFCKKLSTNPVPAKEKYRHYLTLVDDFINNAIKKDAELLKMYDLLKPKDGFEDLNFTLLAQDILYRVLDLYINPELIKLGDCDLYKLSVGDFSKKDFEISFLNRRVAVHRNTKSKGRTEVSQGEEFRRARNGSLFYLCHGNGVGAIKFIGKFTSSKVFERNDGWLERDFEVVARALVSEPYKNESKWWTPNNNSTFVEIPKSEISLANELIFNKYFQLSVLIQNGNNVFIDDNLSKNIIFYGPPGTGKTHRTIEAAVSVIENNKLPRNL